VLQSFVFCTALLPHNVTFIAVLLFHHLRHICFHPHVVKKKCSWWLLCLYRFEDTAIAGHHHYIQTNPNRHCLNVSHLSVGMLLYFHFFRQRHCCQNHFIWLTAVRYLAGNIN
jgi:hypothetical protein